MRMGIGAGANRLMRGGGAAEGGDQGVIDDFDDHLAGGDGAQHFRADRFLADFGDEILDDGQGHVGIQQGQADFPQRIGDVGFAQRAAAAELVKNLGKLARQ